ncbi:MAG: hypothetical protein IT393_08365 [Nitrospirae bacterium]|nr:hypothetical protein [Nitrospirota bacterium]
MGASTKNKRANVNADLSIDLSHLHEEIKKEISGVNGTFDKFRGLLDSFRDIIPEEKQRYQAAIKALSCTSGLNQNEILGAADGQLSELNKFEKKFKSSLPNLRDEQKRMESKSLEIRIEISALREKIARLELEEQEILSSTASRDDERKSIEKEIDNVLSGIAEEITEIKRRVVEFTTGIKEENPNGLFENSDYSQKNQEYENCRACGHKAKWHEQARAWKCSTCGYEEAEFKDMPVL